VEKSRQYLDLMGGRPRSMSLKSNSSDFLVRDNMILQSCVTSIFGLYLDVILLILKRLKILLLLGRFLRVCMWLRCPRVGFWR
jgi:hypothetical protein